MTDRTSRTLTLKDRLSRLTYVSACQLLGREGAKLIQAGGRYDTIDIDRDTWLGEDLFRLNLPGAGAGRDVVVTITLMAAARKRLHWNCAACGSACEHVGAAFSLILEDKAALGLSEPPLEEIPIEHLDEAQLVERALIDRRKRARQEKMRLKSADPSKPWTDYVITSALSGKSYRVALRGETRGASFCSCPDFRTNTLGTCKHVEYVLSRVRAKFPPAKRGRAPKRTSYSVHVKYDAEVSLWISPPDAPDLEAERIARPLAGRPIEDVHDLVKRIARLERMGQSVVVYPDAEELIQQRLLQSRTQSLVEVIRRDPASHPLRRTLLETELLPYQLDGIAFAVGAGRAILADEMGLGKTIQGIGVAELLARESGIRKVLVVCPASVKSQWRNEIHRFCNRDVQLVLGGSNERLAQYGGDTFFTVCNYEQVLRDILAIERVPWDLVILDEGQRIKNWESKTSRVIKGLRSPFALVLSGTPLENRLDELYSVVQFIDQRRLAPAFRFFNRHRVVDDMGVAIGYRNLDELRANLAPVMLRRTRRSVLQELPPRTTEIVRIPPTDEQLALHDTHLRIAAMIARKPFITEMDLLRLRTALLMCRMAADSTFLVDKQEPSYSSKLEHLEDLLDQLFAEDDRKAILFSEWTTMLDRIEPLLAARKLDYVRLDGSIPQKDRQRLVNRFQTDKSCRLFVTTNAGATGLNLQAADTVINVDLPWNPAILEQRIGRAHRMGQTQPVQVYVLVTEYTIEESLLKTLAAKHDLAMASLDAESDVTEVDLVSSIEEIKKRLEVLIGETPDAPIDVTSRDQAEREVARFTERREHVAAAGGELLGAAFRFLEELMREQAATTAPPQVVAEVRESLRQCMDTDEHGLQRLTITMSEEAAHGLAETLARFVANGEPARAPRVAWGEGAGTAKRTARRRPVRARGGG